MHPRALRAAGNRRRPTQKVQGPPGTMKTIAEYQPFANRYGMSINEFELLVLFQSDCQIQS